MRRFRNLHSTNESSLLPGKDFARGESHRAHLRLVKTSAIPPAAHNSMDFEGAEVSSLGLPEERVFWNERFLSENFDFRGKIIFTRFDRCEFVKCTLLIDHGTEQLAFTGCVFKDCNIDRLEPDEARGLYVSDNIFVRPLEERRAEFDAKLAQVLADRKAKGK